MKTAITAQSPSKPVFPEVGQSFCRQNASDVFIRVPNDQGERACGIDAKCYAVSLETGHINWFNDAFGITLLVPTGGTLRFSPKESDSAETIRRLTAERDAAISTRDAAIMNLGKHSV